VQDRSTADLLADVRAGDQAAWDELVTRFSSLLWAIARGHRLDTATAADVVQAVWLRLVEHLDDLREPAALPGWLSTTARRECLRVLRVQGRAEPTDGEDLTTVASDEPAVDTGILAEERDRALWAAFARLGERCRRLLRVLMADPAPSYDEVSRALDMPIGSIGPTRGRCLDRLRTLLAPDVSGSASGTPGHTGSA
jgi:RNA polymerase sigma factor (sigma-70 family)